MRGVSESVSRIGVGHQQNIGKCVAHLADHIDVPAGLDLDLDTLVAGVDFGLNLFEKLRDGILNADGDAAGDVGSRASADLLSERNTGAAGFEIPHSGFETAPSHVMAADVFGAPIDFVGALEIVMQNARRYVIGENGPDGCGPLLVIEGMFAGGDFAPAGEAAGNHFDQNDGALVGAAEAGLKEMHQRHLDLAEDDAVYSEGHDENR